MERLTIDGDSPVHERNCDLAGKSTTGHVKPCGNMGGPSSKAKYYPMTDSERVP